MEIPWWKLQSAVEFAKWSPSQPVKNNLKFKKMLQVCIYFCLFREFWEARDKWYPTWNNGTTDENVLQVDYIRIYEAPPANAISDWIYVIIPIIILIAISILVFYKYNKVKIEPQFK